MDGRSLAGGTDDELSASSFMSPSAVVVVAVAVAAVVARCVFALVSVCQNAGTSAFADV